jgi:hypothetical protein
LLEGTIKEDKIPVNFIEKRFGIIKLSASSLEAAQDLGNII